jgi:hypothetical protein
MAGGTPPFALLEKAGVSFDLSKKAPPPRMVERGTDALRGILASLAFVAGAWVWYLLFRSYYPLSEADRTLHPYHALLKSSGLFGLACGLSATMLILANLLYLPKRGFAAGLLPGSLRAWMTSHVFTGTLAFLLLLFHSGLHARATAGGYALVMMAVLAVTGAVGRYFYAFVPRAANGKEAALEDLRAEVAAQSAEWDRVGRGFAPKVRREVEQLVEAVTWKTGFFGRLAALVRGQGALRQAVRKLRQQGEKDGLTATQVRDLVSLTERAYRTALMTARFEDLRGLLNTWRFLHRWLAAFMVALAAAHIISALRFARIPGWSGP